MKICSGKQFSFLVHAGMRMIVDSCVASDTVVVVVAVAVAVAAAVVVVPP